ncbi:MAG: AAA family ATPase, partial [Phycisphaerales bacterium]|nr:AAA family ATPase [Phycisphaerales bacterium]
MTDIDRGNLYAKLNPTAYQALESATELCRTRRNPYVELIHWLTRMVAADDSDVQAIALHFGLDLSNLAADLVNTMDRLPRGATSITDVSHHIDQAIQQAWLYGSLEYHQSMIRTGHIMVAVWNTPDLRRLVLGFSNEFRKVDGDQLGRNLGEIIKSSAEQLHENRAAAMASSDAQPAAGGIPGAGEALSRFATNLTQQARDGKIDPIVGRDDEIRQVVDILLRRRQNNPILVGEAGVGKTAIVEGFALRLASGDVPPVLRDVELWNLDMGMLQAGAGAKGEFENRLKQVIEDVHSSSKPIILFIDEA